jgi:hypothetical protein
MDCGRFVLVLVQPHNSKRRGVLLEQPEQGSFNGRRSPDSTRKKFAGLPSRQLVLPQRSLAWEFGRHATVRRQSREAHNESPHQREPEEPAREPWVFRAVGRQHR